MIYSTAIGIDLGTTNTVAAIYHNGKPIIIPNREGERLTPSVVFYNPSNLKPSVGKVAEDQSLKCPSNFLFDIKRVIGRNYYDWHVQNFVRMEKEKHFPFHIIRSIKEKNDEPTIKLETTDKNLNVTKSPEEVSAEVLKHIKSSVREHLGFDVVEAVISVPAYFSYAQRAATKRAAEMAGYTVLKLITEPVAAAIHYNFRKPKIGESLLMFDFGGGTLDISIIKVTQEEFTVKAIEGDMFLGGRDFDNILFDYLRIEVGKRFGTQYLNKETMKGQRFIHRLRQTAERFKKMLSNLEEYSVCLEVDMDNEFDVEISRDTFEILSNELVKRVIDKVVQALRSAKMTERDIQKVVLVGGSSRIPMIRQLLSKIFNDIELNADINPDEAVALGASIHAALLKDEIDCMEKYNITELAPFSLGIKAKYDLMVDFIKKGSKLPASVSQEMRTTENDQRNISFEIYEGERKKCCSNNRIGGFIIRDLPFGKVGDIICKVTFNLDENGVLNVLAEELSNATSKQLNLKMDSLTLCCQTGFVSLEEEDKLINEDELFEQFQMLKLQAETYCKKVLYDLQKTNVKTRPIIEKECATFLKILNSLNDLDLYEHLNLKFTALVKRLSLIFHESSTGFDFS